MGIFILKPLKIKFITAIFAEKKKNMNSEEIENKHRPTIVLGDVHGSTYWKKAIEENPTYRYIFIGDYLDPYDNISNEQLINNLNEIIRLKKDKPDDVILLLGNHDLHYFCPDITGKSSRFNRRIEEKVKEIFTGNLPLFTYAFQEGKRLFTHAGVSHEWFLYDFKGDLTKNIAEQFNNPLPEQIRPLHQAGEARGGHLFTVGGIFWADISELDNPLQGYQQYVGHSRVDKIKVHTKKDGQITFCDCLYNKIYLKLDS